MFCSGSQKQMSKEARFHICVAAAGPGCAGLSTYHRVSESAAVILNAANRRKQPCEIGSNRVCICDRHCEAFCCQLTSGWIRKEKKKPWPPPSNSAARLPIARARALSLPLRASSQLACHFYYLCSTIILSISFPSRP